MRNVLVLFGLTLFCLYGAGPIGHVDAQSRQPVTEELNLYVFRWPNGYSEIDPENCLSSGVVTNMDTTILGPELSIDTPKTSYHFSFVHVDVAPGTVATLTSYGLVDADGFDIAWPQNLPALTGPTRYAIVTDEKLAVPDERSRIAFDLMHAYYQAHRADLIAAAQAAAVSHPSPTPNPSAAPVTVVGIEYSTPSPSHP